jgi:hypothetical protein
LTVAVAACGADPDDGMPGTGVTWTGYDGDTSGTSPGDDDGQDSDGPGDSGDGDGDGDGGDGDGDTGDGTPDGCYAAPPGVGENSRLQWPDGSVDRSTAFTQNIVYSASTMCPGINSSWSTKNGPFLGDLNGDGNLDLAADVRKGGIIYMLGDGTGNLGGPQHLMSCSSGGQMDFGDVDMDGQVDLLNGSHSGNGRVYMNNGGSFTEVQLQSGAGLQGAALGDFNGDGALDAVLGADQFAAGSWVFFGDGAGSFVNGGAIGMGKPLNFGTIVTGDFNNDEAIDVFGFIDLDFQGYGGNPDGPSLFLNGGDGTTWQLSQTIPDAFPQGAGQPEGIAVGDVDCDGNADIAMAGRIFLGDGNGGLSQSATLHTHTFGPHMNLGDMDGDGNLDAIVADWITGVRIFYGDGTGTNFEEVEAGLPREDAQTWLDVGDLNNNGNLDLVLFHFDGGPQIQTWIR